MGQQSSLVLSAALQSAMLAFNGPVSVPGTLPNLPVPPDFRTLNGRHRLHLIVKALTETLAVGRPSGSGLAVVHLNAGGRPILSLSADTLPASRDFWTAQIRMLEAQKWHREERLAEIALQQTDLRSFLALAAPIGALSHPWLGVLLDAVQEVAFRISTEIKVLFSFPRPFVLSPDLAPVIQTPSHSSFPSGHATEAFAAAAVLSALYPDRTDNLRRMAARIAENRGYAGVHYPVDHHAGAVLGDHLGRFIVQFLFDTDLISPAIAALQTPHVFHAGLVPSAPVSALGADIEDYALSGGILRTLPNRVSGVTAVPGRAEVVKWLAREVLADVNGRT